MIFLICLGQVAWWWPGYRAWGGLVALTAVVLALWLLLRIVSGDRTLPGHPLHWVLAGPAGVLIYHFSRTGLGSSPAVGYGLSGALNVSLITQLLLLAGLLMLCQSLLAEPGRSSVPVSLCGAAMMLGPAVALTGPGAVEVGRCLRLLGASGALMWLVPLVGRQPPAAPPGQYAPRWVRAGRSFRVAIGVCALLVFTLTQPALGALAASLAACVVLAGAAVLPEGRKALLWAGVILVLTAAGAWALCGGPDWGQLRMAGAKGLWGAGEEAFADLSADAPGLVLLSAVLGWGAVGWLILGHLACVLWFFARSQSRGPAAAGRSVLWAGAAVLASASFLQPGGVFVPSATLAVAFVWGIAPSVLSLPCRTRPGAILFVLLAGLMFLLGIARNTGLLIWTAEALGWGDQFLHGVVGFFLAMSLVWLIGLRKVWAGLGAILLAALAGGAGELLQGAVSRRLVQWSDWRAHLLGTAAVLVPYLLAMGSRWCESREVRPKPQPLELR